MIGGLILVAVALMLRRILRMGAKEEPAPCVSGTLHRDDSPIYQPIAREIETQITILGITLNEAFGERDAARHDMAWHVVRLAVGEWERLNELVIGLQSLLSRTLPTTEGALVIRRVAVGHFKSRACIDNVALYEFLDQVLFSSKRRFALKLRLLFRASVALNRDFRTACREGERTTDASPELWNRLDYYFHDFDLLIKETLLAFQTLLAGQSPEALQSLASDIQMLLERGTRVSISPSDQ